MDTKTCSKCYLTKPKEDFYKSPGMKDGRRNDCISCCKEARKGRYKPEEAIQRAREWNKANPDRVKANQRRRRAEKKEEIDFKHFCYRFNLTSEEGLTWLKLKGQPCLICSKESTELDHDHETKTIRGWLCGNCNRGLGLFGDNPAVLRKAAIFLERNK